MSIDQAKKGNLVTLMYPNGLQISGIVTDVTEQSISITYYDFTSETLQITGVLKREEGVECVVCDHLPLSSKSETSNESPKKEERFFMTLSSLSDVATLAKAFVGEKANHLAILAQFLTPEKRTEFFVRLPDELFKEVQNEMKNIQSMEPSEVEQIEKHLQRTYQQYVAKQQEKKSNESERKNPFEQVFGENTNIDDLLNEAKKRLAGGRKGANPFGDLGKLFGGGNQDLFGEFGKMFGGKIDLESFLKDLQNQQNNEMNQPPIPSKEQLQEMIQSTFENLPDLIRDLLNPNRGDDDDTDFRS